MIKFGGKWYTDSHPGWFGGHWWWLRSPRRSGVAVGLLRRLTRLPWQTPGLFDDLKTEHVDPGLVAGRGRIGGVADRGRQPRAGEGAGNHGRRAGSSAARDRVLATLRFFRDAPQGTAAKGMTGYKGFYYHFLDMQTGMRYSPRTELSLIDTSLLIAGVLLCESYFDRADPQEAELREIADELYRRVDWSWASRDDGEIALGWSLEYGFHPRSWRGYNEAMILYVMALGSPTHSIPETAWQSYSSTNQFHWDGPPDEPYLSFPPLFVHQYSHVWIDFRDIRDAFMRDKRMDYFENSRRATWAQQRYAIANPMRWKGYGPMMWGISACDGPADVKLPYGSETRVFHSYAARGIGGAQTYDDGTLAPSALAGSMPFAPELVLPALENIKAQYGQYIYSSFGFLDAFNPSFDYDVPLMSGRRIPGVGWFDSNYLGIDQGLTVTMIENYRSGMIWRIMRQNPYMRRGLERAGFKGGWLEIHP